MKETGKSLLMIGWISNFILYWSMFNGKWKYGIKSSKKSPISSALSTEKFFLQCTFSKAFITSSLRFSSSKLRNQKKCISNFTCQPSGLVSRLLSLVRLACIYLQGNYLNGMSCSKMQTFYEENLFLL